MNLRNILIGTIAGLALLSSAPVDAAKKLKGAKFDFVCQDTLFKDPFVDIDETRKDPLPHRYIHGGFADGTRFSFYFPIKKEDFTGRFFQYITPFPDSEVSAQAFPGEYSMIGFSIYNGAYFVETNEGGQIDFSNPTAKPADIGAYRANAACAQFSRHIAQLIYDCDRPYGYCFGGSGGAYRTTGSMESTEGVWDGACPYVLGSPQAIPNVFAVRMLALRVLEDKMGGIVDALLPGGSGDPYAGLTAEEAQIFQETTRMGFPAKAWYGYKQMTAHGFRVLYKSVVAADPTYFSNDFWNVPGYAGYEAAPSLLKARVQKVGVIKRIVYQEEGEAMGIAEPLNDGERGSAELAWKSIGSDIPNKPAGYELDFDIPKVGMGCDMIMLSGKAKGQVFSINLVSGKGVGLGAENALPNIAKIEVGDTVQIDNSNFLAVQYYYRHQVATPDYYVWNQFRGIGGQPIYPQRERLIGRQFTMGAAGCLPSGKIHGKMILCCSVWDREAFAWQGDWYRGRVTEYLGDKTDDNFRLWYTDRATHGEVDDPTEVVTYMPVLQQALLDISDWVERGIEPSNNSDYQIEEGQVVLTADGANRGAVQPVPDATVNGGKRIEVKPGEQVTIKVAVDMPKGTGKIIRAEWCVDNSKEFTVQQDLSSAVYSNNDEHVEFEQTVSYDEPGTYFPTVIVYGERNGNAENIYANVRNLDKVRIIVK